LSSRRQVCCVDIRKEKKTAFHYCNTELLQNHSFFLSGTPSIRYIISAFVYFSEGRKFATSESLF